MWRMRMSLDMCEAHSIQNNKHSLFRLGLRLTVCGIVHLFGFQLNNGFFTCIRNTKSVVNKILTVHCASIHSHAQRQNKNDIFYFRFETKLSHVTAVLICESIKLCSRILYFMLTLQQIRLKTFYYT